MDEWRLYGDEGKRNGALSPPSQRLEQWLSLCVFYQGHERRTISLSAINSTVSFEADYPSVEAKGNKGLGDNRQHWGAEVPLLPGGNAPFLFCHNSKIIIIKKSLICQRAHLSVETFCTLKGMTNLNSQCAWQHFPVTLPVASVSQRPKPTKAFLHGCLYFSMQNRQHSCENLCLSNSEQLK